MKMKIFIQKILLVLGVIFFVGLIQSQLGIKITFDIIPAADKVNIDAWLLTGYGTGKMLDRL